MFNEVFGRADINPRLPEGKTKIKLTAYARSENGVIADTGERWGVLILPGGGYEKTAPSEGEPIALAFLAAGVQAFVLDYSVLPDCWPQAFLEACAAMDFIRRNKAKYGISRLAVCGFSAGGHLTGCVANLWAHPLLKERLGLSPEAVRPDAAILSYPVITARPEFKRQGSFTALVGSDTVPKELSLEQSVTPENPPTFLWSTFTDDVVPVGHSLAYASALNAAGVPYELHIFSKGPHGMGLATKESAWDEIRWDERAAAWQPMCVQWLATL